MGSCAVKQTKIESILQRVRRNQEFVAFNLAKSNKEYLDPKIRGKIYKIKDEKAPRLHLETNTLYLKHKLQVQSL